MEGRITPLERDCLDLIKKKMSLEITMQEYCDGLMVLNSKYPGLGFNHVADSLYHKWIKAKPQPKVIDFKMRAAGNGDEEVEVPF